MYLYQFPYKSIKFFCIISHAKLEYSLYAPFAELLSYLLFAI